MQLGDDLLACATLTAECLHLLGNSLWCRPVQTMLCVPETSSALIS
jgi:hypothetical protein